MNCCQPSKHNYHLLSFDILLRIRAVIQSNKNSCAEHCHKPIQQKFRLPNSVFLKIWLNCFQCCKAALVIFFPSCILFSCIMQYRKYQKLFCLCYLVLDQRQLLRKLGTFSKSYFRDPFFRLSRLTFMPNDDLRHFQTDSSWKIFSLRGQL